MYLDKFPNKILVTVYQRFLQCLPRKFFDNFILIDLINDKHIGYTRTVYIWQPTNGNTLSLYPFH